MFWFKKKKEVQPFMPPKPKMKRPAPEVIQEPDKADEVCKMFGAKVINRDKDIITITNSVISASVNLKNEMRDISAALVSLGFTKYQ
jgi:hypothetical protein